MTIGIVLVGISALIFYGIVVWFVVRAKPGAAWVTHVTPLASILVAMLSLLTTWYVFYKSAEATRNTVRPFITFEYVPWQPVSFFRNDNGMTDTFGTSGVVTLTNVGSTPAYNVRLVLSGQQLICSVPPKDFFVLPHVPKSYSMMCDGKDPKFSPSLLGTILLTGNISYRDVNGFSFSEPTILPLCLGPLDSESCKNNMKMGK